MNWLVIRWFLKVFCFVFVCIGRIGEGIEIIYNDRKNRQWQKIRVSRKRRSRKRKEAKGWKQRSNCEKRIEFEFNQFDKGSNVVKEKETSNAILMMSFFLFLFFFFFLVLFCFLLLSSLFLCYRFIFCIFFQKIIKNRRLEKIEKNGLKTEKKKKTKNQKGPFPMKTKRENEFIFNLFSVFYYCASSSHKILIESEFSSEFSSFFSLSLFFLSPWGIPSFLFVASLLAFWFIE